MGHRVLIVCAVAGEGVAEEQAVLVQRGANFEIFDIGREGAVLVGGRPCRHGDVLAGQEIWIGESVLMPLAHIADLSR